VDALKATAFVDDQPKNLSAYGLDRPGLQATFMTADADPVTLLLGSKKGEQVYAKAKHAAPVYLVKGEILDLLGAGVAGLRNKQALDFKSDDAAKVILKYPDATIVCQKQGANWRLTAPVQENAKNGAVTAIVYQVNALKAERFLSDVPRLAETGLDTPDVQLSVVLKNGTEHVLQIGKPTQDGNRYARLRSSPETVFLVTETLLEALKVTVDDLRETPEPG